MQMLIKLVLEGIGLGAILVAVCGAGIWNGAVGMVHLYHKDVQDRCVELGYTTHERIKKRAAKNRRISMPVYIAYVVACVYGINGARGFTQGFLQLFVILSVMNLIDRFLIDEYWVGHTKKWIIPGTEDLQPYINANDKVQKWLSGTIGMAVFAAAIAGVMTLIIR